jgi:hypothetical protein
VDLHAVAIELHLVLPAVAGGYHLGGDGLQGGMNWNLSTASGFSGMLQLGTKFHTQLPQDDFCGAQAVAAG